MVGSQGRGLEGKLLQTLLGPLGLGVGSEARTNEAASAVL